jgi:hypothetical protein
MVRYLDNEPIVTEIPIVAIGSGKLDVRIDSTQRGAWAPVVWVTRTIDGEHYSSNQLPLALEVPPQHEPEKVPTRIDSITPPGQYPGDRVVLRGLNLDSGPIEWTLLDGGDAATLQLSGTRLSDTEVEIRLPRAMIGGNYRVQCLGGLVTGVPSNVVNYAVGAYRFRVDLTRLACIDETNPEAGTDDIVTMWAVAGDAQIYGGTTGTLGFGEDGATRNFAPGVYTIFALADAAPVRVNLYADIKMFEWDEDDVAAAQKWLGVVSGLADELAPLLVEIPIAAFIAALVGVLANVASWVVSWNGNDFIAEHTWSWTIEELLALTANSSGAFTVGQQFYGDGGHYDLFFKVTRYR